MPPKSNIDISTGHGSQKRKRKASSVVASNVNVDKSKWPLEFQQLSKLHYQINTISTFLQSRKYVVPSFSMVKKSIEGGNSDADMKTSSSCKSTSSVEIIDVSRIKALLKNDLLFHYVHESEVDYIGLTRSNNHNRPRDEYQSANEIDIYKDSDNMKYILILWFPNNVLKPSKNSKKLKAQNFQNLMGTNTLQNPTFKIENIMNVINTQNDNFDSCVEKFLRDCVDVKKLKIEECWDELDKMAQVFIPHEPDDSDPIQAIISANKNNELMDTYEYKKPIITEFLTSLKQDSTFYHNQIVKNGSFKIPKREARYADSDYFNTKLSSTIRESLHDCCGITNFYNHQWKAIDAVNKKKNVIITTSTSSGKSLIYQVPVLEALEKSQNNTALYIFPTKALAQDQKRSLTELISSNSNLSSSLNKIIVETYDGDTPHDKRKFIAENSNVIFSNPDMIHASILPNNSKWRWFLRNLKFIVVDELHLYNGLFGSHVSLIMRRLRRLCWILGNEDIIFISCSATINNAVLHMGSLFGIQMDDIVLVDEEQDGSPTGAKNIVVWDPQTKIQYHDVNTNQQISSQLGNGSMILPLKTSPILHGAGGGFISETGKLFVKLISSGIKTIVFCKVRKTCELILKNVRYQLEKSNNIELLKLVMGYRGGYSASDRREIESQMFHGKLMGIVATNALELGVDIGSLDAVLICGFPYSKSSFRQQSGRAGRRNEDSLTIIVGSDDPVDQFYMTHPTELINKNATGEENLVIDFRNRLILEGHIQCAAFEYPFNLKGDINWFIDTKQYDEEGEDESNYGDKLKLEIQEILFNQLIIDKEATKLCGSVNDPYYTCHNRYLPWPSSHLNIRNIQEDEFAVVDVTNGGDIVIETIETSRTSFTLYEGGIFLHQGLSYLVKEFNPDEKFAKVEKVDVNWITKQRDFTDVDPMIVLAYRELVNESKYEKINKSVTEMNEYHKVFVNLGEIQTTIIVFGYFKCDNKGNIIDVVEVKNPPIFIKSKGFWIDIPDLALEYIKAKKLSIAGGIHAAQHLLISFFPKIVISSLPSDIGTECKAPEKEFTKKETARKRPARLIFYDGKGGEYGCGFCAKAFHHIDSLLLMSLQCILSCKCKYGCPKCIAYPGCKENNLVLSKSACILILMVILGIEVNLEDFEDGPEPNMPSIEVESIISSGGKVRMAPNVEILKVRKVKNPVPLIIKME